MKVKTLFLATACIFSSLSVQAQSLPTESVAPVSVFESRIYRDLFSTEAMRNVFSDEALIEHWIKVEVALARAQSKLGIIPKDAYESIQHAADTIEIDYDEFRTATNKVGRGINPLLDQLKKAGDKNVSTYLHYGSTTQDIMDTATVLPVQQAAALIRQELVTLTLQLADLAEQHRHTVMISRTNGQDAIPTTLGLHLTTYMMELNRHVQRLDEATSRLVPQIGGTVGTLSAYGDQGLALQESMAAELGLKPQLAPWNPSRDTFAEVVQTLALVNATLGRVAVDVNNYGRTQIGELQEGESGASSTMPQKRNPRASEFMGGLERMGKMYNAAALDIMSHTDTRQGAPWILEWSIIPESFMVTATSINRAQGLFANLIVNEERMLENFNASSHYVMSEAVMNKLAGKMGRASAYAAVKAAIRASAPEDSLEDVIRNTPAIHQHLSEAEIQAVLDPDNYLGAAEAIVERSVEKVRSDLKAKG